MKIIFTQISHYLEVVFPLLKIQYNWKVKSLKDITNVFLSALKITRFTRRSISPQKLRKLICIFKYINNNPADFNMIKYCLEHLGFTYCYNLVIS